MSEDAEGNLIRIDKQMVSTPETRQAAIYAAALIMTNKQHVDPGTALATVLIAERLEVFVLTGRIA